MGRKNLEISFLGNSYAIDFGKLPRKDPWSEVVSFKPKTLNFSKQTPPRMLPWFFEIF